MKTAQSLRGENCGLFDITLDEGPGKLKILYQVRGEKASTLASVKFQHEPDGWKYHLIAFKLSEDAEPASEPVEKPAEKPAERP